MNSQEKIELLDHLIDRLKGQQIALKQIEKHYLQAIFYGTKTTDQLAAINLLRKIKREKVKQYRAKLDLFFLENFELIIGHSL